LKENYGLPVINARFLEEADNYFTSGGSKVSFSNLAAELVSRFSK